MCSTFQLSEIGGESAVLFGEYIYVYIFAGKYYTRVC